MNERKQESYYENLEDLAQDSSNLVFQLLRDRVLKFDVGRSLEINTFFLNYNLLETYFIGKDMRDLVGWEPNLTEEETLEHNLFMRYIERLNGIFILIPMKYKGDSFYTKAKTDEVIDQAQIHGDLINSFFVSHEDVSKINLSQVEDLLEDYVISHHFLPYLDYDPAFQPIIDSKAINQLFYTQRPLKDLKKWDIQRFSYPVEDRLFNEMRDALNRLGEKMFSFNTDLPNYNKFLSYWSNYVAVLDFGSKPLIAEAIQRFKDYYSLRVSSRKEEISQYLNLVEQLFSLSEGKLYTKFPWNKLITTLRSISEDKLVDSFLERFCINKMFLDFPKEASEFDAKNFISEYNQFLSYACYCYSGQVHTGAPLIWRAMIKYFEELQFTQEFRDQKGALLENWCLEVIEEHGFQAEKIILRNKDVPPNDNYWDMKEQVKSFKKEPLEFEVEFIEHQKKYPFHEIDVVFRAEKLMYLIECKSREIRFSESTKYASWGSRFERILDIHYKKRDNLAYSVKNGSISNPFFEDIVEYIPIILQTEGVVHKLYGFDTDKFRTLLSNVKKHQEEGTLMKDFESS